MTAINYVRNLPGGGLTTHGPRGPTFQSLRRPPYRWRWGFCTTRSLPRVCRRRVVLLMVQFPRLAAGRRRARIGLEPHVVQFPPIGGGEDPTQRGVAPTVQTTSAQTGDTGLLRAKWPALWARRCLSWRAARTATPEHAREPLDTHVNPSTCTWAGLPTCRSSGPRAGCQAHVQVIG